MKARLLAHTPLALLREASGGLDAESLQPHLGYTFAVERISRACSHQLVRHRVASFSQQSQRYITVKRLQERVVMPPSVEKAGGAEFKELVGEASEAYQLLVDKGVPKEDARFVLPNAAETSLLMTMDGRSLFHFFGLRCCNRAQWEIRALADAMLKEARDAEPEVFDAAGPYCYQLGYCPEGRFTCGRMQEALDRYRA
ncbi:thymidylate synthase, flavin-dependent [Candidatus Bathyarchaeota archaeon RBG_16_57_9]|nr:MAG: thymidylate synthase, flavin-dependent [Candidatus Bathyarchaeota archaeon RBG_16_57_9]OGD53592.1 MAG: thymidylate synthase, flavin-dependent [Candidatus Bathyarchaeota archaeon RBG_13_60_20]